MLLYTSLAGSDIKAFRDAFQKAYPGVKLEIYRASGTTILQKILTESRAGNEVVDATMTQDNVLHVLKGKNLLAKFDSSERRAFDSRFKEAEGYWTDVYPTVHSIPYNTKLVAAQGLSRAQWDDSINLMIRRHGMPALDDKDRATVLGYLEAAYPPRAPAGRGGWQNPFAK